MIHVPVIGNGILWTVVNGDRGGTNVMRASVFIVVVLFLLLLSLVIFGGGIVGTILLATRKKVVPAVLVGVGSLLVSGCLFIVLVFLGIVGVIHGA